MPKVSIVIPVYNTEKFLVRCLNSVLCQSVPDVEIICVNDGSTDGSLAILQEYAAKDNRIKVISQENKGQSAARNRALRAVNGEYVFFLDSDDFIHSQTLEILLKTAETTGCSVVSTEEVKVYDGDNPYNMDNIQYCYHQKPLEHILSTNIASSSVVWNKLYKAELVKDFLFVEGIYFEDWPWITCLFAKIKEYASVPYGLYGYNNDNESIMRSSFTVRKINDYATGIKDVQAFFAKSEYSAQWPLVRSMRISASLKMMINKTYHEKNGQPALDKHLFAVLKDLHQAQCFKYRELPVKVLLRISKIRVRNLVR